MKANITYKSVLSGYKNIEARNKAFDALDDQSKRLEIAWDALQLVLKEKVDPSNGCYWSDSLSEVRANSKKLQELFVKDLPECEVCQRGLMMVSQIRLGNSISGNDDDRYDGSEDNIKGFTIEDFQKMENEYERSAYEHPHRNNTAEKLANICCNVLINGNFKPSDDTNYLI